MDKSQPKEKIDYVQFYATISYIYTSNMRAKCPKYTQ